MCARALLFGLRAEIRGGPSDLDNIHWCKKDYVPQGLDPSVIADCQVLLHQSDLLSTGPLSLGVE
jgi:hypothetical protein